MFSSDYKDIQRTAKINVPKGTEIGSRTSLASQRLQECAKICVKKCKRAKNWKIDFADVCIFSGCKKLVSITIPSKIAQIEQVLFHNCTGLSTIIIRGTIHKIGFGAFENCEKLSTFEIPTSVETIENHAFTKCCNINKMFIPKNVKSIGSAIFSGCTRLTSLVVDTDNIYYDSRNDCNAIIDTGNDTLISGCSSTSIPTSVKTIGDAAFAGCVNIESIEIPDMVDEIGQAAFGGCKKLRRLYIPESTRSIRNCAFYECTGLVEVSLPLSLKELGNKIFYGCSSLNKISIPIGAKEKYEFLLPDYKEIMVENECRWIVKDTRPFNPEEIAAVKNAEVVASQYGKSVCFFMQAGGQTYIPLSNSSSLTVGDSLDMKTAKILFLSREGKDDIVRILE